MWKSFFKNQTNTTFRRTCTYFKLDFQKDFPYPLSRTHSSWVIATKAGAYFKLKQRLNPFNCKAKAQAVCASGWLFEYRWMTLEIPCGVASAWPLHHDDRAEKEIADNLGRDWSSIFYWAIYLYDLSQCINHTNGKTSMRTWLSVVTWSCAACRIFCD